jgi:hypothetical protein
MDLGNLQPQVSKGDMLREFARKHNIPLVEIPASKPISSEEIQGSLNGLPLVQESPEG